MPPIHSLAESITQGSRFVVALAAPSETPPVIIEQGPEWLVEFYLFPPWWLNPSLKLVGLVVAGIVAYRLYQRGGEIPLAQQRAVLQIAATVIGVMTGVLAMANYTTQPYAVDVAGGFLVGYGVVTVLATVRLPLPLETACSRIVVGWALLAVSAFVLPPLAAMNARGTLLPTPQFYIVALGVAMSGYNLAAANGTLPFQSD